jgi:hypothetical protein
MTEEEAKPLATHMNTLTAAGVYRAMLPASPKVTT